MRIFVFSIFLTGFFTAKCQQVPYSLLYDDTLLHSIYIVMDADSLEELYDALENEHEYAVQFMYKTAAGTDTLEDVGFRLRGNTSLYSAKKSFKVSFNTYNPGRKYQGAEKLNLIGNHNDPSMSREKLYFDLYNALGLPVRRVSFVKVFINDEYYGLYTNIEEYDEIYLKNRFGDNTGNLFKCVYGSNLEYNGTSISAYGSYELQTNEEENDYSDLMNLTNIITNTPLEDLPCELEEVFHVDNFLKIYALDIATGHWDNYGANQNNFYLYHNQLTGQFEFMSYDCDNTLGIDWLGTDWAELELYTWHFDNRPLVERLMQIEDYKNRFSYYMQQIINTILLPDNVYPHIDSIKTLITEAALEDDYKGYDWGYTDDDFLNAFDTDGIDGHTPYGIKNFIAERNNNTAAQLTLSDIFPVAEKISPPPLIENPHETAQFVLSCSDDGNITGVELFYNVDGDATALTVMFDDGLHGDGEASDNIYGIEVDGLAGSSYIYYHFQITDNNGNTSTYPLCDELTVKLGYDPPALVINELLAKNDAIITDLSGEYADYVEIYNKGNTAIYLGDTYLTDAYDNPSKWRLPEVTLLPDTYILLWADNETVQGEDHCDFKLSSDGEQLGLFAGVSDYFSVIDTITFGAQTADVSFGRIPNGSGAFTYLTQPSPGSNNEVQEQTDTTYNFAFSIAGNPYAENSIIQLSLSETSSVKLCIYAVTGQVIDVLENTERNAGNYTYTIPLENKSTGIYFLSLTVNQKQSVYKLCIP
jgi:hypothetical protein